LLLTSVNRCFDYISPRSGLSGKELKDTTFNRRELTNWITSISRQVEKYLGRNLHIESRVEYFNTSWKRLIYYPSAWPIASIASVKTDSLGLFQGDEATLTSSDYEVDKNSEARSFHLVTPENEFYRPQVIQLTYTGGMAYHSVNSVFAVTESGTWNVNKYAVGQDSGAVGIVKSVSSGSLTIENLYGIFESGETINEQDNEDSTGTSAATATIDSITRQSLVEAYPDIVRAVEVQIRYMWAHKNDFENSGTSPDGVSIRRSGDIESTLQPEARDLLYPYRNEVI